MTSSQAAIRIGTVLAGYPAMAIGRWGNDMENANQPSEVPVSNWTLATGTRPGERHIYPAAQRDASCAPASEGR